jgi:phosphoribosylpyrophosphate synthetase
LKPRYLKRLAQHFRRRSLYQSRDFKAILRTYIRDVIQPRYVSTEMIEFFGTAFNAMKRGCTNITAVWPFSDGRSDRFSRGENNESAYLAHLAKSIGISDLFTLRMHSKDKQQDIWQNQYKIAVHNISAIKDLAEKIVERYEDLIRARKLCLTSIDLGGKDGVIELTEEVRKIAYEKGLIENLIDIPYTIMDKDREAAHKVKSVEIHEGYGKRNPHRLEGMTLLAYDDMIDTSGSLMTYLSDVAEKYKVQDVIVVVEHPVFSYPAIRNLTKAHRRGLLKEVITYDTIEHPQYDFHVVLDSKPLLIAKVKEMFFPENGIKLPQNPDW